MALVIDGRLLECNLCRWRWMYVEGRKPQRCPNPDCRTSKWDRSEPVGRQHELKCPCPLCQKEKRDAVAQPPARPKPVQKPPVSVHVEPQAELKQAVNAESAEWRPYSRCRHGYQNSLVCRAAGGGC
jgi:hypothetical protein